MLSADSFGQWVGDGTGEVGHRPVDPPAQLPVGEARGQRMDGHETAGVDGWSVAALVVGVLEDQQAALSDQTAAEGDGLADRHADAGDAVTQPGGIDRSGVIANGGLELLQPSGEILDLEPLERTDDGAFGLKEQIADRRCRWIVDVPTRKVEQQVLHVRRPEPCVQPRPDGADAFERLDWGREGDARWRAG